MIVHDIIIRRKKKKNVLFNQFINQLDIFRGVKAIQICKRAQGNLVFDIFRFDLFCNCIFQVETEYYISPEY